MVVNPCSSAILAFRAARIARYGRLVQQLVVVGLRRGVALEQQVRVRVDEARQHRHLGQIDHAGTLRLPLDLGQRADGLDAVAFDQDADARLRRIGSAVDQAARLDEHRRRGLGSPGRLRPGGRRDGERGKHGETGSHRGLLVGRGESPRDRFPVKP